MAKISKEEIIRLKGLGCLTNKQYEDCFNVRVLTRNGKLRAREQKAIAEASELFGSGEVTLTTRMTMEIQAVPYENLEPLFQFLAEYGLETGGTGKKVRPVVSCKGTTCTYGNIDTFHLSEAIHERFYRGYHEVILPHKFKIAVGGCPNNCIKPDLNDIGVMGLRFPKVEPALCRGCKSCKVEKGCTVAAADLADGILQIHEETCNKCGGCIDRCPFDAVVAEKVGYQVTVGGRWGKKTAQGKVVSAIFSTEEDVLAVIEAAILLFKDEGVDGERFAETIERLGFEYVEKKLRNR